MCGIVGVIGALDKQERNVFQQLLFADTFRGYDSTGIFSLNYQDIVRTFKKAVSAPDFLQFKQIDSMMYARALVGHNRWATKGGVNNVNAHPFTHGRITGVHNGTLRQQSLLPESKDFDVDSENIFYSLNKIGEDETIKRLNGAFALVWHDAQDNTIKMVRNDERPLHYAMSDDEQHVFFASEKGMLLWILARNGVKFKKIEEVKEGRLYTFTTPLRGKKVEKTSRKVEFYKAPVVTRLPAKTTPATSTNHNSTSADKIRKEVDAILGKTFRFRAEVIKVGKHLGRDYVPLVPLEPIEIAGIPVKVRVVDYRRFKELEQASKDGSLIEAELFSSSSSHEKIPHYFLASGSSVNIFENEPDEAEDDPAIIVAEGYDGELLTEKKWKEATKGGCVWCASPAVLSDENLFIAQDQFICPDCKGIPMIQDYLRDGGVC